jgi:transcriptional regulator with XRE-family HTH domain
MEIVSNISQKQATPSLRQVFATNVKIVRIHQDLSQEALADLCQLDRTFIGTLERGIRNISIDNIELIAAALKTPAYELLDVTMPSAKGYDTNVVRVAKKNRLYPIGRRKPNASK